MSDKRLVSSLTVDDLGLTIQVNGQDIHVRGFMHVKDDKTREVTTTVYQQPNKSWTYSGSDTFIERWRESLRYKT